jgi:ATP-dependent exoDNAse (exonuclease V) beta subunit
VSPGLHVPRAGTHGVVWWDPYVLALDVPIAGGLRQRQILQADASGETAVGSIRAHLEWRDRRANSLAAGARPSLRVSTVTAHAKIAYPTDFPVAVIESGADRLARPNGRRLGSLVHAVLQLIDVRAPDNVGEVARGQARVLGASEDEIRAAIVAVRAALAHPLMQAAAAADVLRRETPVILQDGISTIEGVVDLAFLADGAWAIVDFKTDPVLAADTRATYEAQVRLYARAISDATGQPASAALFLV